MGPGGWGGYQWGQVGGVVTGGWGGNQWGQVGGARWVGYVGGFMLVGPGGYKKASSYIAQYPVLRTIQSTVHSDTISASLGSIQPYATINCSYTYPSLSIARYSFIQLSEYEQCRVKKLAQGFNTAARIRTRVLIVESPKLCP